MQQDAKLALKFLKVDGGASNNDFLMQFQSDILNVNIDRPKVVETTALGAAYLAGLAVGFYESKDAIKEQWKVASVFNPKISEEDRDKLYRGWNKAVGRTLSWEDR